jgi:hypothetical protein
MKYLPVSLKHTIIPEFFENFKSIRSVCFRSGRKTWITLYLLGVLQIIWEFLSLRVQNTAQEIRQNRGILSRVRFSWARRAKACIPNDGKHFKQLPWCFNLFFYSQLQSFYFIV